MWWFALLGVLGTVVSYDVMVMSGEEETVVDKEGQWCGGQRCWACWGLSCHMM